MFPDLVLVDRLPDGSMAVASPSPATRMTHAFTRWLLIGLIAWALAGCAYAPPTLPPAVAGARFVLLGEVHDNPRHHAERAQWLQALLADGRPTRVVFEQMDATLDSELRAARNATPTDSTAIARAGGLDAKAWRWPLHQPLFARSCETARCQRICAHC